MAPAHAIVKIDSVGPRLKMRLMLETELKELIEEDPDVIAHVTVEDRPVLTASTKELQAFVLKYADGDKVFSGEIVLQRRD
jgi:hypothetical protein